MRVQSHGGVGWCFGLEWHYLAGLDSTTPVTEARQLMRDEKSRLGVLHLNGERHVLGMVRNTKGLPRRAYSAAIACARFASVSLVVAQLGANEYWVCIAGAGRIDPAFDQILSGNRAQEAISSYLSTRGAGSADDMPMMVVDRCDLESPWLAAAERTTWLELLGATPPENAKIRALGGRSTREVAIVLGAIVLIGGVLGYDHWSTAQRKQRALEQAVADQAARDAAQAASEAAQREAAIRQAVESSLVADTETPSPQAVYSFCLAAARQLGRFVGGYQVLALQCGDSGVFAQLSITHPAEPTFGTPERLMAAADALGAIATVAPDFRSATLSLPAPAFDIRPRVEQISDLPGVAEHTVDAATTAGRLTRGDAQTSVSATNIAAKSITYLDPTVFDEKGNPKPVAVPAARGYQEGDIVLTAPMPGRLPIAPWTGAHIRLDSMAIRPDAGTSNTTITLKVILKP